jgi:hypothetical protein
MQSSSRPTQTQLPQIIALICRTTVLASVAGCCNLLSEMLSYSR